MWIEAIGIGAGALILSAVALKELVAIKSFLLGGSTLFLAYGLILSLPAIIIVNSVGVCIGIYGLISALRLKNAKSTKQKTRRDPQ